MKKNKDLLTMMAIQKLLGKELECCGDVYTWSDFTGFAFLNKDYMMMELISPTYPNDINSDYIFIYSITENKIVDGFSSSMHIKDVLRYLRTRQECEEIL